MIVGSSDKDGTIDLPTLCMSGGGATAAYNSLVMC